MTENVAGTGANMSMSANMKMDRDELNKRIDSGLITVRKHPFLDLYICNYTARTQHDGLWDEYTERCRGLIMDGNGNILNNPFRKFFNIGEKEYTKIENLPAEVPNMTEKLDGMLGILYEGGEKGDEVAVSTRGTFDSPYAEWATNWLRSKGFTLDDFKRGYTYLWEIIYPGSKNVVNYGSRSELVLLAVRSNDNSHELDHVKEAKELGVAYAKEYSFDCVDSALKYIEKRRGTESEGFVFKYSNGLRVKMKSSDYKRLHKLLTGLSARDIWRSLRDVGNVNDIIEHVPDEFFKWVNSVEMELKVSQMEIMKDALDIALEAKKIENRIDQASFIIENTANKEHLRGVTFSLLDGRVDRAQHTAWQRVKPSGDTFRAIGEEI